MDGGIYIVDEDKSAGSSVTVSLSENTVNNNGDVGIYFNTYGDGEIHSVSLFDVISDNEIGVYVEDNAPGESNSTYDITVNNGDITGNGSYGISNTTTNVINAENEWWGNNTGPFHPEVCPATGLTNPGGLGDPVSNYVDYEPWSFGECMFVPGDVSGDGNVIGSDVTYAVNYFRSIGSHPPDSCFNESAGAWLYTAADANGSCEFIGSDVTFLINFFRGSGPPPRWCPETPPAGGLVLTRNREHQSKVIPFEESNKLSANTYR